METPPPDAPRREHRPRVLKGGTIITGFRNSEISCSLRNQHSQGAELKVAADIQIPVRFLLYVPIDGIAYKAVVRWRKNDRVGVEFEGTEPKPKFHCG
ncbi:MAG: PilZ domain-containing protein [Mesorhizobium sp.]|nr:MAG: PilZ domain-containing protein [Mesorhizobium sp.]